jgi:hypothetical protein
MFSRKDKEWIATKIEEILLALKHPEMPHEKPKFKIIILGRENWSWAEITDNHTHANGGQEIANTWNEIARDILGGQELTNDKD